MYRILLATPPSIRQECGNCNNPLKCQLESTLFGIGEKSLSLEKASKAGVLPRYPISYLTLSPLLSGLDVGRQEAMTRVRERQNLIEIGFSKLKMQSFSQVREGQVAVTWQWVLLWYFVTYILRSSTVCSTLSRSLHFMALSPRILCLFQSSLVVKLQVFTMASSGIDVPGSAGAEYIIHESIKINGYNNKIYEEAQISDSILDKSRHDLTHRQLRPRHIQLIGIGGTIGAALYVQIGRGLINGGPASLFMTFTI